jgi:hypothetical protein
VLDISCGYYYIPLPRSSVFHQIKIIWKFIMAKQLICPSCGNIGEATIDNAGAFEVRGQFQGKVVRKCNKCGAGLLVGLFSGGLLGKPKLVPPDLWGNMQEMWDNEFSPHSRRESIPASQLGNDLAEMTLDSASIDDVSDELSKKIGESLKIDGRMRMEWLILKMFAYTRGVQKADISQDVMKAILDNYHFCIYQTEFTTDEERAEFEQHVRDKYISYQAIFEDHGAKALEMIGFSAAKQIIGSEDIVIALLIAKLFHIWTKSSKDFVESVSKDFDLVM